MLEILLIGTGGVGTMAALALEKSEKARVTCVVRGDYRDVIANGFEIDSVDYGYIKSWRPSRVVNTIDEAVAQGESYAFVILSTKVLPEIYDMPAMIAPAITPKVTVIVHLQNGIGMEQETVEKFPGNIVLGGVSMIGSHKSGVKIKQFEHDHVEFAYCPNNNFTEEKLKAAAEDLVQVYGASGIPVVSYASSLMYSRWKKLVYNACINTTCALVQLDTGCTYLSGLDDPIIFPAMQEIIEIAASQGIHLPEDIAKKMINSDDGVWYEPSMLVDVNNSRLIELEAILGYPLKLAKKSGIRTPVLSAIYHLLRGVQFRIKKERGMVLESEPPRRNYQ